MRLFISAGEPSGDLHGSNLITQLRERIPGAQLVGFGGERMAAAGCDLLYPLCQHSAMFYREVIKNYWTYYRMVRVARLSFDACRPDGVVLIDFPGFHWHIARNAHELGIPVFYFVPPQLWAWGGWRIGKMRRWVDHVLCTLPFEWEWYNQRGMTAQYLGHPYFDELATQRIDQAFLGEQRSRPGRVVAILPGSRSEEVKNNLPAFLAAARQIQSSVPEARFLVASFNERQRQHATNVLLNSGLPVELHVGRTPEIIRLADACMSVSGSVGLELLNQAVPTVVYYQITLLQWLLRKMALKIRWVSLINLLAGEELVPELVPIRPDSRGIAAPIIRWLTDARARAVVRAKMIELRDRVAEPGACGRAAEYIKQTLQQQESIAA